MTFLGGSAGSPATTVALFNEVFVAQNGSNAIIKGFSSSQLDGLDLSSLLSGAPLSDLVAGSTNLPSYLSFGDTTTDASSGATIYNLNITGMNGQSATVGFEGANAPSSVDQLYNSLILPKT